jgi:hypothetical protein
MKNWKSREMKREGKWETHYVSRCMVWVLRGIVCFVPEKYVVLVLFVVVGRICILEYGYKTSLHIYVLYISINSTDLIVVCTL